MLYLLFPFFISYLLGSIPTAYIYGKAIKGIDIRKYGSKNIGATNSLRVLGKKAGLIVLAVDLGKGLIAVLLIANIFYFSNPVINLLSFKLICGIATVLGHIYPLFLRFKGGKGMATSIGVLLGVIPAIAVLAIIVWLSLFFLFGYVSLSSICAVLSLPLFAVLLCQANPHFLSIVLFTITISSFVVVRHKENIKRLLCREEEKVFKKSLRR